MSFIFNQEGYLTLVSKKYLPSKSKAIQCAFCYYSLNVYWGRKLYVCTWFYSKNDLYGVFIILPDGKKCLLCVSVQIRVFIENALSHHLNSNRIIWGDIFLYRWQFPMCIRMFIHIHHFKKCVSWTIPHFMYYYLMLQSFCDYKNHIKGILNLLVLISSLFQYYLFSSKQSWRYNTLINHCWE